MELVNFELYNEDFEWDHKLHFPVPTLEFIKKRTGEDMLESFDTALQAKGSVISITRSAKNYLFLIELIWRLGSIIFQEILI